MVGAFIIIFAVLWWRGVGCLDRKRPVTPSPPESVRPSFQSDSRSQLHVPQNGGQVVGRRSHEEGWHHLPNPTLPRSTAASCKSGRSAANIREKDKLAASMVSLHSTASSPRKNENKLPYIKASSPPPPTSPSTESVWKIPRSRSAASFRSAASSPAKEPYIRASSEASREPRERRISQQEHHELRDRTTSSHREDLAAGRVRKGSVNRTPSLNRKPSLNMMLKNSSRVSLGAVGYVTTQERLRDQEEEEETRDWTKGMKPLDVDHL